MAEATFSLPEWAQARMDQASRAGAGGGSPETRMQLAIELARENVDRAEGGPFAALVSLQPEGKIIAVGINRVVRSHCSLAHAEMMALARAQASIGSHDLGQLIGDREGRTVELLTTAEPCAMCFGALPWSGITHLVCGARAEDTESIGFDEGPKPQDWRASLEARGISCELDVLREQACALFHHYAQSGGAIYNASPRHRPR